MNIMWNIKHLYSTVRPEVGVLTFVLSCLLLIFFLKKEKRRPNYLAVLCLGLCITAILGSTILNRSIGQEFEVMLIPLWSYWEMIALGNWAMGKQILFNVLIFVPFGVFLPLTFSGARHITKIMGSAMIFSAVMELLQLMFQCGTCEFDDVFSNVLGAVLGYTFWQITRNFVKKIQNRQAG